MVRRQNDGVGGDAAAGRLPVIVTYLEMTGRPHGPGHPLPARKLALLRAERPTLSYYRYLYTAVGSPWLWADRLRMGDDRLIERLRDPRTEIYVLYHAGVPAGFAELFRRDPAKTELVYFGLMPEFIGQGIGPWFLDAIIDIAWQAEPARLTVETCTLDHPKALALYQRAGFVPYRRERLLRDDPRRLGLLPADAPHGVPPAGG
jgi:GNAT superfamily N-acetyltransferase